MPEKRSTARAEPRPPIRLRPGFGGQVRGICEICGYCLLFFVVSISSGPLFSAASAPPLVSLRETLLRFRLVSCFLRG